MKNLVLFSVDVINRPATQGEIQLLQRFSPIEIPSDYIDLVKQGTECEIKVLNEMYIRIWGLTGCIELMKHIIYTILHSQ